MKHIYLLLTSTFLLCLPCNNILAQAPYKASVGGMLPCASNAIGPSFKSFLSEKVALQVDLLYKSILAGYIEEKDIWVGIYSVVELNTNVVYQKKIKDKKVSELFWFVGSGISLGCEPIAVNGKFGANAIVGLEYVFKNIPLSIQIEMRPGYGMLFNLGEKLNDNLFIPVTNPWSHFDWLIDLRFGKLLRKKMIIEN